MNLSPLAALAGGVAAFLLGQTSASRQRSSAAQSASPPVPSLPPSVAWDEPPAVPLPSNCPEPQESAWPPRGATQYVDEIGPVILPIGRPPLASPHHIAFYPDVGTITLVSAARWPPSGDAVSLGVLGPRDMADLRDLADYLTKGAARRDLAFVREQYKRYGFGEDSWTSPFRGALAAWLDKHGGALLENTPWSDPADVFANMSGTEIAASTPYRLQKWALDRGIYVDITEVAYWRCRRLGIT